MDNMDDRYVSVRVPRKFAQFVRGLLEQIPFLVVGVFHGMLAATPGVFLLAGAGWIFSGAYWFMEQIDATWMFESPVLLSILESRTFLAMVIGFFYWSGLMVLKHGFDAEIDSEHPGYLLGILVPILVVLKYVVWG